MPQCFQKHFKINLLYRDIFYCFSPNDSKVIAADLLYVGKSWFAHKFVRFGIFFSHTIVNVYVYKAGDIDQDKTIFVKKLFLPT